MGCLEYRKPDDLHPHRGTIQAKTLQSQDTPLGTIHTIWTLTAFSGACKNGPGRCFSPTLNCRPAPGPSSVDPASRSTQPPTSLLGTSSARSKDGDDPAKTPGARRCHQNPDSAYAGRCSVPQLLLPGSGSDLRSPAVRVSVQDEAMGYRCV